MILDSIDKLRGKKKRPNIDSIFYFLSKTLATNIDKDTLADFISQLITLKILVNKKTPNGHDSLYLSNTEQRETEPTPETKLDKIDDDSVQTVTPNTPKETPQSPIQTEKPLLQNVRQIPKPSAQQKTLTFEQFKTPLTHHLEERLTAIQEKFESYCEKISKTVANIECCQNQNTKTLQQNIANLKNELVSKNEIITTPINKQMDLLEKSKSRATIRKSPYKDKHQYNQRLQQENLQKSQVQQNQTQKSPQVERKRIYIGNLSKNSSEEDIARLFGLTATSYFSENGFIEISTGRKNRNYAFITTPEHVCNELIKLNGVAFQDMCLKVQEARQSDTGFNERRNITKSSFERNMKNAADSIYSPNLFELLKCETTENDENDHPYHKDTSTVGSDTINHHSRYKQSKRPEVVVNRFPENQHTFQKKCTVPCDKTYKEAATEKTNTTHTNNVAIFGDSIISFSRGIKSEFNKTLRPGRERFKNFPGASSKDLLHYIDPTLEEQNFETR